MLALDGAMSASPYLMTMELDVTEPCLFVVLDRLPSN